MLKTRQKNSHPSSSTSSSASYRSQDEVDAITPCPLAPLETVSTTSSSASSSSSSSRRSSSNQQRSNRHHHHHHHHHPKNRASDNGRTPARASSSNTTTTTGGSSSWRSSRASPLSGFVWDEDHDGDDDDDSNRRGRRGRDHRAGNNNTERLWRQMLAVQDRFGCYNSARMAAALEMGRKERGRMIREFFLVFFFFPSTCLLSFYFISQLVCPVRVSRFHEWLMCFVASRTCLNLINDSIGEMPEDTKQRIELFLEREGTGSYGARGRWKRFWYRVIYVWSLFLSLGFF